MKSLFKSPVGAVSLLLCLIGALLLFVGCGNFDAPTPSQSANSNAEYWTPKPGDRIDPDHDVPILNPDYWTPSNGNVINPFLAATASLIGLDGGVVMLGRHNYNIPRGAINLLTRFTISYASMTGVAVDCGPSPMSFRTPVTLTLSYAGTQYDVDSDRNNGNPPPDLHIYYAAPDGSYEQLPSTINPAQHTITAQVDHFSRYIIG